MFTIGLFRKILIERISDVILYINFLPETKINNIVPEDDG